MSDLIPHTSQPITNADDTASYEMRGWMESISSSASNNSLTYTVVSGDITTTGSQFLRVTTACTVTLNPLPRDGETVQVQPDGNFTVTISGIINGVTPSYMHVAYDLLEIRYVQDLGEWVA